MSAGAAPGKGLVGAAVLQPEPRRSHALETFAQHLGTLESLQIADFGGLNQANLDFITGLGHRVYAEDLLYAYDYFFSDQERSEGSIESARLEEFLNTSLDFPDQTVDAVLAWDVLQFLTPSVAAAVVQRLFRALSPDALLLAFFHPETDDHAHPHACRILDEQHLLLAPKRGFRPIERYNTRAIEKFFQGFRSVKFFMTRDRHREVLVRR